MADYLAINWDKSKLTGIEAHVGVTSVSIKRAFEITWPEQHRPAQDPVSAGSWLKNELHRLGVSAKQVLISFPRHDSTVRLIEIPDVPLDEIPEIVRFQTATKSSVPLGQLMLDYLLMPVQEGKTTRDVLVVSIGKDLHDKALKTFQSMGLEVAYCGRNRQDLPLNYFDDITELARACDVLILAAPGTEETQGIVDEDVLDALGRDGFLINIGRGALVNEADLAAALAQGRIAGAGLDVFADEPHPLPALLEAPNTMLLPHVASASDHTRDAMGQLVVDNVTSWFERGRPVTPVPESRSLLTE